MVTSLGAGVLKANNPNSLSEFGGNVILTDMWTKDVLKSMDWVKRKGTTDKPSKQLLVEDKFTFQMSILKVIYEHDIPSKLVINLDQTPFS